MASFFLFLKYPGYFTQGFGGFLLLLGAGAGPGLDVPFSVCKSG